MERHREAEGRHLEEDGAGVLVPRVDDPARGRPGIDRRIGRKVAGRDLGGPQHLDPTVDRHGRRRARHQRGAEGRRDPGQPEPRGGVDDGKADHHDPDQPQDGGPHPGRQEGGQAAEGEEAGGRPQGKHGHDRAGGERRAGRERVDLDGLGEPAGKEEGRGAQGGGPGVRVARHVALVEAEPSPEAGGQRRRPGGDAGREAGEAHPEDRHHDADRDHEGGHSDGGQHHGGPDRAEHGAQDREADDPAPQEDDRRTQAERDARVRRGRPARREGGREGQDEAPGQGHAGGDAGRQAQQPRDDEAPIRDAPGAGRERGQPAELGRHGDRDDEGHPACGGEPRPRLAGQPGRPADPVAGGLDRLGEGGGRQRAAGGHFHASVRRGRGHAFDGGDATDVALDPALAGATGHALDRHDGDDAGRGPVLAGDARGGHARIVQRCAWMSRTSGPSSACRAAPRRWRRPKGGGAAPSADEIAASRSRSEEAS